MSSPRVIPLNQGDGMTLTASAALVVDGEQLTLVDPGSVGELSVLEKIISRRGFEWKNVNQVFYTHLHFDHYDFYPWPEHIKTIFIPQKEVHYINALMQHRDSPQDYSDYLLATHERIARPFLRQFVHYRHAPRYHSEVLQEGKRIRHYDGDCAISPHCRSVALPGHCLGLHGLAIDMDAGRGIIAADAVLSHSDWLAHDINAHMIISNSAAWWQSREKLTQFDWILPGHGAGFFTAACPVVDASQFIMEPTSTELTITERGSLYV